MFDAHDLVRLQARLESRGAHPALLAYVTSELPGPDLGVPEDLPFEDCELLLECALLDACEPRVQEQRLKGFHEVASRLGYDDDQTAVVVRDRLGITERRLASFAVLGLPLHADPAEIKATHRAMARALHPDRLQDVDAETRATADRLMGRLNHARAVLTSGRDEVVTTGADDIWLDLPDWDPEDAPTESCDLRIEDGLTDALEPCA